MATGVAGVTNWPPIAVSVATSGHICMNSGIAFLSSPCKVSILCSQSRSNLTACSALTGGTVQHAVQQQACCLTSVCCNVGMQLKHATSGMHTSAVATGEQNSLHWECLTSNPITHFGHELDAHVGLAIIILHELLCGCFAAPSCLFVKLGGR